MEPEQRALVNILKRHACKKILFNQGSCSTELKPVRARSDVMGVGYCRGEKAMKNMSVVSADPSEIYSISRINKAAKLGELDTTV